MNTLHYINHTDLLVVLFSMITMLATTKIKGMGVPGMEEGPTLYVGSTRDKL